MVPCVILKLPPVFHVKVFVPTANVLREAILPEVLRLPLPAFILRLDKVRLLPTVRAVEELVRVSVFAAAPVSVIVPEPAPPIVNEFNDILGTAVIAKLVAPEQLITTSSPVTGSPPVQRPVVVHAPPVVVLVQVFVVAFTKYILPIINIMVSKILLLFVEIEV